MKLKDFLLASAAVAVLAAPAAAQIDPVIGKWWNVKKTAHIEIAPCGDSVCGNIVWMQEPNNADGTPKRDVNNDDETLRDRTIQGLQIIGGFEKEAPGVWDDGEIYNPEDGNTYSSNMAIQENGNLAVEGCVLFLCREQVWEPVKE
ncbi:DUF2147 domain-containing protein [Minwuia thermotolerans]|nr:DUF2147 domain-containing protein [Minwuia thermotolerans]